MRIGHGFDVHRFEDSPYQKKDIVLGGVSIPFHKGLIAHSDGDVLIHALCDALLGALALGDIGRHFPDTDPKYKGIDSRLLLQKVMQLLVQRQYDVINADVTVICEKPKLKEYIPLMQENLAQDLNISGSEINIKATTSEGLDATGQGLGVAVHAVVLIQKNI